MFARNRLLLSILVAAMIGGPSVLSFSNPAAPPARSAGDDAKPEYAPIVERKLDFYNFTYQSVTGAPFDLREYAKDKTLLIVEYFAGWCPNSNRNGHVIQRLSTRYRASGLGVVGVSEYSNATEFSIHIGRIGIDYPVVLETKKRDQRKDSSHYKYRRAAEDKRKWGTPFYVIIEARDIEPAAPSGPLARRVFTISGEMVEEEADRFIRERVAKRGEVRFPEWAPPPAVGVLLRPH